MSARRRADLLSAVGLAAIATFVFGRALGTRANYDEGVYLASLELLRGGEELGRDIYAPQPPVFYWILRLLAAPFGESVVGIRIGFVALAVVGVVAAFAAARQLYGLGAGLAAGVILVIAAPFPSVAPTIAADIPSLALGLVSLALVARAVRPRTSGAWGAAAGAVVALAILTKFLAAPFLVPLFAIPLAARCGRRVLPLVVVAGLTTTALVLLVHVGSLSELWAGAIGDHDGARALTGFDENVERLRTLLELRRPFGVLVIAGALAFVFSRPARRTWPLATLVPAAALFTLYLRPLVDHHLSLMACAYAVSAGPALALAVGGLGVRARYAATAAIVVLVALGLFKEQRRLERNDVAEPVEVTWATEAVRAAVPPTARFTTDLPIVSFRAGRRIPGSLTDTSWARVRSKALLPSDVLRETEAAGSVAVLAGRMFTTMPRLLDDLDRRYPVVRRCGNATLYLPAQPIRLLPPCPV